MIGVSTSAMVKFHMKSRRRPRLRRRVMLPYVLMVLPFAAESWYPVEDVVRLLANRCGKQQRSLPVSMRNRRAEALSVTNKRRQDMSQSVAAFTDCCSRFPVLSSYKVWSICWLSSCRSDDTSTKKNGMRIEM